MKVMSINVYKGLVIYSTIFWQFISPSDAAQPVQIRNFIYLNIHYKEAKPNDTLTVSVDNILFTMLNISRNSFDTIEDKAGCFRFKVPVNENTGIFTITKLRDIKDWETNGKKVKMLESQLWESGDSIDIFISFKETRLGLNSVYEFSGKGAEKYNLINKLKHIKVNSSTVIKPPPYWNGNILSFPEFDSMSHTKEKLRILNSYRNKLSYLIYNIIKSNIIYEDRNGIFSQIRSFVSSGNMLTLNQLTRDKIVNRFSTSFDNPNHYNIDLQALAKSTDFIAFLLSKLKTYSYLATGELSMDLIYKSIKEYNISVETQEVLITACLWSKIRNSSSQEALYNDAAKFIKNPQYLSLINELYRRLPGKMFEEFALIDTSNHVRTLSEFKNKVVLIDFWFTGCSGCATFYKNTLSKVESYFKDNSDVVVLSISMDVDKQKWLKSINDNKYTSNSSVNLYTNGMGFKHPIILNNNIISAPYVILLDRNGKIKLSNSSSLYKLESLVREIKEVL